MEILPLGRLSTYLKCVLSYNPSSYCVRIFTYILSQIRCDDNIVIIIFIIFFITLVVIIYGGGVQRVQTGKCVMLMFYCRPSMSITIASAASLGISAATIVHVAALSMSTASDATSLASTVAASVASLKSTEFSPLLHHPLDLQDRVCH